MDFSYDATTIDLQARMREFMDEFVYPAEHHFHDRPEAGAAQWERPDIMADLKKEARERGLWNLFLPGTHDGGAGLSNLQYAPLRRSQDGVRKSRPRPSIATRQIPGTWSC